MAKTKTLLKTFNIEAIVKAHVNLQIEANSFNEALEKARDLGWEDFIEVTEDANMNDGELVGISYIGADDYEMGFKLK